MNKNQQTIISLLAQIKDSKTMEAFLQDLLTPQELEAIASRWQLVKLLDQGFTHREIAKRLGISIATVTRGSRQLKYGHDGFKAVLRKYDK